MNGDHQYRFVMPGPIVQRQEWEETLIFLENTVSEGDYLVASGSLPPGIPDDFYAKVAAISKNNKTKFILDTSGSPLMKAVKAGVYLLKPNLGELSAMCKVKSISIVELETLAQNFLKENPCEVLVVSLGPKGAMLVTSDLVEYIPAPTVHQKSTIGAGDSMVAGMTLSIAMGKSISEMAGYGVACGSAATMNPGTQLFKKEDVNKLYDWIKSHQKIIRQK